MLAEVSSNTTRCVAGGGDGKASAPTGTFLPAEEEIDDDRDRRHRKGPKHGRRREFHRVVLGEEEVGPGENAGERV